MNLSVWDKVEDLSLAIFRQERTLRNYNGQFYTYLLCLRKLGYVAYLDVKKLIYAQLGINWTSKVTRNNSLNCNTIGFTFSQDYVLEIPAGKLVRLESMRSSRCKSWPKQAYVILDKEVIQKIRQFETHLRDRGYPLTSCLACQLTPEGEMLDLLVLNTLPAEGKMVPAWTRQLNFDPLRAVLPPGLTNQVTYKIQTGKLITASTILRFHGVVNGETRGFKQYKQQAWKYQFARDEVEMSYQEKFGDETDYWRLRASLRVARVITPRVFRATMKVLGEKVLEQGWSGLTKEEISVVRDYPRDVDFEVVYSCWEEIVRQANHTYPPERTAPLVNGLLQFLPREFLNRLAEKDNPFRKSIVGVVQPCKIQGLF